MTDQTEARLLIKDYLGRLSVALQPLPLGRRREIVNDIAAHIREGSDDLANADLVGLQDLLDRLGDPEDLALDIIASEVVSPKNSSDAFVPWLILLGAIVFGVGWLIGVLLLWKSKTWRIKDKIFGTLVLPGGLWAILLIRPSTRACSSSGGYGQITVTHCTTSGLVVSAPWNVLLVVFLIGAPLLAFLRLTWVRIRGYRN